MNLIYLIGTFFLWATHSQAELVRAPADYRPGVDQQQNISICRDRYQQELEFTSKTIKTLSGMENLCDMAAINKDVTALSAKIVTTDLGMVAKDYKHIMEKLAGCRTQVLLSHSADINQLKRDFGGTNELTKKIFLHVLGDAFGTDTGLEGGNASITLAHRIRELKVIKDKIAGTSLAFINDKDHAQPCSRLPSVLPPDTYRNYPQPDVSNRFIDLAIRQSMLALKLFELSRGPSLEAFRTELKKHLAELKVGSSIYFPSSWSKHAIVFELVKEDAQHISFRMFNSGDGINVYHASLLAGFAIKYFPYVEILKVPIAAMTSLVNLSALKEVYAPKGESTKPEDFYDRFLPMLGGVKAQTPYQAKWFKTAQNAGTCSYSSLPWVMSSCLSAHIEDAFNPEDNLMSARLEDYIRLLTLSDYGALFKALPSMKEDEEGRNLFKKGLAYASSKIIDSLNDALISQGELTSVIKKLHDMKADIKSTEEEIVRQQQKDIPPFILDKPKTSKFPDLPPLGKLSEYPITKILLTGESSGTISNPDVFTVKIPSEIPQDKASLAVLLADSFAQLSKAAQAPSFPPYLKIMAYLENISRKLPLEKSFWNGITPEQSRSIISSIARMSELYLYCLVTTIAEHVLPKDQVSMAQVLTILKNLSIADLINQNHVRLIPSMLSPTWGQLFTDDVAVATTMDPMWQRQFNQIKSYYTNTGNGDFFGFNVVPTGAGYSRRIYDDKIATSEIERLSNKDIRYEDKKYFPDMDWATELITSKEGQADYTAWKSQFESSHTFDPYQYLWRYSGGQYTPPAKPAHLKEADPVSRNSLDNLKRLAAAQIIAGQQVGSSFLKNEIDLFSDLRNLAVVADFILTGNISGFSPDKLKYSDGIKYRVKEGVVKIDEVYELDQIHEFQHIKTTNFHYLETKLSLFGQTPPAFYVNDPRNEVKFPGDRYLFSSLKPMYHLSRGEGEFDIYYSDYNYSLKWSKSYPRNALVAVFNRALGDQKLSPIKNRLTPNEVSRRSEKSSEDFVDLGLEQMRSLFNLIAVKNTQLDKTLNFFLHRPYLLAEGQDIYRSLFEKLMFDPGLLDQEFSYSTNHQKAFATRLAQFCKTSFNYFAANSDVRAVAFVLRMNDLFKAYAKNAQVDAGQFLDSPAEFVRLIDKLKPEQVEERSFLYRNMAYLYVDRLPQNIEDIKSLLLGVFGNKIVKIGNDKFINKDQDEQVKNILLYRQDQIVSILSNNKDDILNNIVSSIVPGQGAIKGAWQQDGNGMLYKSTNIKPQFALDLANGTIYQDGKRVGAFPIPLDEYRRVFGQDSYPPTTVKELDDGIYEWIDPLSKDLCRAFVGPREYYPENYYLRQVDTVWYSLLSDKYVTSALSNQAIMPTKQNWVAVSLDEQVMNSRLLATDHKTGQKQVLVKLSKERPIEISRYDNSKLINTDDAVTDIFNALEDKRHIYVWGDDTGKVIEVDISRLGLKFKAIPNTTTLDCGPFADYQIARDQYVSALGLPKNYLVCESKNDPDKPKIVLMVAQQLHAKNLKKSLVTSDFESERMSSDFHKDWSPSIMVYRLKGDSLEPQSNAARYYLALYYLWQQKYEQSKDRLDPDGSEFSKLKSDEKQILTWVLAGNSDDHDVRALALRLTALYSLGKDYFYYDADPQMGLGWGRFPGSYLDELLKDQRFLYDQYLNAVDTVASGVISHKNELMLAELFAEKIPEGTYKRLEDRRIISRVSWLKAVSDGQKPRDISLSYFADTSQDQQPSYVAKTAADLVGLKFYFSHGEGTTPSKFESGVLKVAPGHIITLNNFKIFCLIAAGVKLTDEQIKDARAILLAFLGASAQDEIKNLSEAELKDELMQLVRAATIKPGSAQYNSVWEVAQFILNQYYSPIKGQNKPWDELFSYLDPKTSSEAIVDKLLVGFVELKTQQSAITAEQSSFIMNPPPADITTEARPLKSRPRLAEANVPGVPIIDVSDPLTRTWEDSAVRDIFDERAKYEGQGTGLDRAFNEISEQLGKTVASQNISADIKAAVNDLQKRIITKQQDLKESAKRYVVKDWLKLSLLNVEVQNKIKDWQQQKEDLTKEILALARRYDPKEPHANYDELLKIADIEREVTIDDVIYLLLTNKIGSFYAINGSLTATKAVTLRDYTVDYLVNTTTLNHLNQILMKTEALLKFKGKPDSDADLMLAVEELATLLNTKRAYSIAEHVEYLVFEHFSEKLLRPQQKEALDSLKINQGKLSAPKNLGVVMELIMGAGKTSVIVPLLSMVATDGKVLNVVVLPESLITSMAQELSTTMSKSFKKHIDVMIFGQGKELTRASIPVVKQRLLAAKNEGRTIVTTNSSLQSLFLSFINRLDSQDMESLLSKAPRQELKEIFKLFRDHGHLTIDEVDLALDVMRAQQIAVGNKLAVKDVLKDTVSSFYHLMASDKAIFDKFNLPFLPYSKGTPVTDKTYPELKKLLIDKLTLINKDGQSFLKSDRELDQLYVAYLKKYGSGDLKNYWNGPTKDNRAQVLDAMPENRLKDVVAIIAEELNATFALTAPKKINIQYGPLPKAIKTDDLDDKTYKDLQGEYEKSRFIAIPYQNGTPLVRSRFASDIEQINYTIQKDLKSENFLNYVEAGLEDLKKIDSSHPSFAASYQKLAGNLSLVNIRDLTDQQKRAIADSFKGQKRVAEQIKFCKNYALSQIRSYEKQLQTNAQIYEFLFNADDGFSGTLWNFPTYPDIFQRTILSDTSPLTILILLSTDSTFLTIEQGGLYEQIAQIYNDWREPSSSIDDKGIGSFIDEAGMFRGFANDQVAGAIIDFLREKNINTVDGVIYYDESDHIVIMDKNHVSMPIARTTIPIEKRVAFWDKQHTTGSDLKLSTRMKAKMSVDSHIRLRDAEQSVWRLRKLGQGQRVIQYVAYANELAMMKSKLATSYQLPITNFKPVHLLVYSILNQQEQLSSFLNWRAFGQRLKNKLIKAASLDVLQTSIDSDESARRYKENGLEGLFAQKNPEHLHEIYGLPMELMDKDLAIKQEIRELSSRKAYNIYNTNQEIDKAIEQVVARDHAKLPDKIMMPRFANQGTELQIELNLETQTQTQQQTQKTQFDPSKNAPLDIVMQWNLPDEGEKVFTKEFFTENSAEAASGSAPLIFTAREASLHSQKLSKLFDAVDKNISFSANFARLNDVNFAFFDQHSKELSEVLVIYNSQDRRYSLILLDGNDVDQWKEFLARDRGSLSPRSLQVAVYSLFGDTIIAEGANVFDHDQLKNDPDFLRLIVQAKFLAGVVTYRKVEEAVLAAWIRQNGVYDLREIFKSYILSYKDITNREYNNSFIADVFGDQP